MVLLLLEISIFMQILGMIIFEIIYSRWKISGKEEVQFIIEIILT